MGLICEGAAYRIELKLYIIVVLAIFVALVLQAGLYSGLPEVFHSSNDCMSNVVVEG